MKKSKMSLLLLISAALILGCQSKQEKMKTELVDFIKKFDSAYIPLFKAANLASWNAAISGKPEDFQKSQDRAAAARQASCSQGATGGGGVGTVPKPWLFT